MYFQARKDGRARIGTLQGIYMAGSGRKEQIGDATHKRDMKYIIASFGPARI